MTTNQNANSTDESLSGSPVVEILRVAGPAMVTMLSYVVMQFVDTLVVASLGPGAVSAVGNGGVFAFTLAAFLFGTLGVINTYVSQNFGAGRPERGAAYAWNGLWMVVIVWAGVMLPVSAVLPWIFGSMERLLSVEADAAVTADATAYARVATAGMVFTLAARGLAHYFYGMHRASWVMIAAIVGNAVNIPVTIGLVFGWWGLPRLEVAGAALGTVIGSVVELGILLGVFLGPKYAREFATRRGWRLSWRHIKDLLKLGWPAGLMFGNELFCWWVFMAFIIGGIGRPENDASWIVLRYMHVSFMPAVGLSMAVTAVVGKVVGAGRMDLATRRMLTGLGMAVAYMGLCALVMVVFRHELVAWFAALMTSIGQGDPLGGNAEHAEAVVRIGASVLIVAAAFQVFDATAITVVGALRGAGDTVWPGVATAVLSWAFIIGVGLTVAKLAPSLGALGPWLGAAGFIISLAIALALRWRSGRWREMAVAGPAEATFSGASGEELRVVEPAEACPEAGAWVEPGAGVVGREVERESSRA